jgi:hypothetical protein
MLKRFSKDYKILENEEVIVGDILPAKETEQLIEQFIVDYRSKYG